MNVFVYQEYTVHYDALFFYYPKIGPGYVGAMLAS